MKAKNGFLIILMLIMLAMVTGCASGNKKEAKVLDPAPNIAFKASAVVNGEKISEEEFNKKFLQVKLAVQKSSGPNFKFDEHVVQLLGERTLDGMIDAILIQQELARKNLTPTKENLDKFIAMAKKAYKSEADFNQQLKEFNMTEADFIKDGQKQLNENTLKMNLAASIKEKDLGKKAELTNSLFAEAITKLRKDAKIERNNKG